MIQEGTRIYWAYLEEHVPLGRRAHGDPDHRLDAGSRTFTRKLRLRPRYDLWSPSILARQGPHGRSKEWNRQ
jgi:hypothetical protein